VRRQVCGDRSSRDARANHGDIRFETHVTQYPL
jgi:hypothetical protein